MKRINWKNIIATVAVCLIPIVISIFVYDKMPQRVPVHFNIYNEVDRYASKNFALFGIPFLMALLQIFSCVMSDINQNRKIGTPVLITIVNWIIPVMSNVVYSLMVFTALGISLDIRRIICIILSVVFIIIGNYLPKMSFDSTTGKIVNRRPKTEKGFRKSSKAIGYTFVVFGILLMISIIFKPVVSFVAIILLIAVSIYQGLYYTIKYR